MGGPGSGVRKVPTPLKVLRGSDKRYIPKNEPQPSAELPVEPTGPMSDGAIDVWDRIVPDLVAKKVATGWDVHALMEMCECIALLQEARASLERDGKTIVEIKANGLDSVKLNPMWRVYCDSQKQFIQWAARFGLTPSDRAGLDVGKAEPSDSGADLLSG